MKNKFLPPTRHQKQQPAAAINVDLSTPPDSDRIKSIWASGWRPNVVLCVTCNSRVLLCFDRRYNLWQFPQGGVEPGESVIEGLAWELTEELGDRFAAQCGRQPRYLGQEQLRFSSKRTVTVNPTVGEVKDVKIAGKIYFLYGVVALTDSLSAEETEFDQICWCSYDEAKEKLGSIDQDGKKRISLKAIELLKVQGLLE